jgi:hypothetical protein
MTTAQGLLQLLDTHVTRYPALALQDVYKLLYQGILGSEHLMAEPEAFTTRLLAELAAVSPTADEPLYEPVRADGRLFRVNLRPFKACGGDPDRLSDACLEAAKARWDRPNDLRAAWAAVAAACQGGRWAHLREAAAFSTWLDAQGYPAVHHSPRYREAYRPAYRLISDAARGLVHRATR